MTPEDPTTPETVIISLVEYEALIRASDKLDALEALEAHGVDNWLGYDDAMAALHGEIDPD